MSPWEDQPRRMLRAAAVGDVATKIALNLAFEEDVIAAMMSRWISELEPYVVRDEAGWIRGLTHVPPAGAVRCAFSPSRPFWHPRAPMPVTFEQITLGEIRDHYERRRRRRGFPLRLVSGE